jgi:hypothetical protein
MEGLASCPVRWSIGYSSASARVADLHGDSSGADEYS